VDKKYEFSEGDAVRISESAFASFFGTVVSVNNQDERLTVVGRFKTQPDSDLHTLNASFFVVGKVGRAAHGAETILLVEDDEIVRRVVKEVLNNDGYRLLEAASGVIDLRSVPRADSSASHRCSLCRK
jgi:hypothetical protein